MYIVIVGAGTVGTYIAEQFIQEGMDVTLIEKDAERARYVANHLDCIVINDQVNSIQILKEAGIEKADYFISVTDSDEVNMISCGMVSSEFRVPYKIARVRNLEYAHAKILDKTFLDIDLVVNPEVEAARIISQIVEQGATSDVFIFEDSDVQMRNLFIDDASPFSGKSLREIKHYLKQEFLVGGISRKDTMLIPSGNTVIQENDNLYLLSTRQILEQLFSLAGKQTVAIHRVLIVGGGRIGTLLADVLGEEKYTITIVEKDYERCKFLAELFPEVLILNAEISDKEVFDEERLYENNLIITTTNNQELNIIGAIYGKSRGIPHAIAVVTQSSYLPIASEIGIDSTVNPKNSAADTIIQFIRGKSIKSVHSLFDGTVETIEFTVDTDIPIHNTPLRELQMPENALIASVTRNNNHFVPNGDFIIQEGDTVIIIAKKKAIQKIIRMFSLKL
jgi:trk system potassium uptake protein TrkA